MVLDHPKVYQSDDPEIFEIYRWEDYKNMTFKDYLILWSSFLFVFVVPFMFGVFCLYSFVCIFLGTFWPMGTVIALFLTLNYKFEPTSAIVDSNDSRSL